MILPIVGYGHPTLRKEAREITKDYPNLKELVANMYETMYAADGVGLAAPQVGISRRFFVTEAVDDKPRVFINPEIIETSQETVKGEEGCLSLPGVWANVVRPYSVKVQAQDLTGKIFHLNAEGWLARIILHENDHLNGLLFVDRLPQNVKNKVINKYEKMSHS